jgi:23S rRNA-/tRNA-specific pseudouridylate synthase
MGVDSRGKESLTCYRVLCNLRNSTLLEVRPQTGRKHQIRVHLYSIGHPVLGDRLYGYCRPVGGITRLMLHAYRITFTLSGNRRTIEAPPDQEWERIISRLG